MHVVHSTSGMVVLLLWCSSSVWWLVVVTVVTTLVTVHNITHFSISIWHTLQVVS